VPLFDWTVTARRAETVVAAPYPYPPLVGGVSPQSAALAAGLRQGDVIVAVDGDPIWTFDSCARRSTGRAAANWS
jgi:regulator of sigma E protease